MVSSISPREIEDDEFFYMRFARRDVKIVVHCNEELWNFSYIKEEDHLCFLVIPKHVDMYTKVPSHDCCVAAQLCLKSNDEEISNVVLNHCFQELFFSDWRIRLDSFIDLIPMNGEGSFKFVINSISNHCDDNVSMTNGTALNRRQIGRCDSVYPIGSKILTLDSNASFKISKEVFALHSAVFEASFYGNFMESSEEEIRLPNVGDAVFAEFVDVLYFGRPILSSREMAAQLLEFANERTAIHVMKCCVEYLFENDLPGDPKEKSKLMLTADRCNSEILMNHILKSFEDANELSTAYSEMHDLVSSATSIKVVQHVAQLSKRVGDVLPKVLFMPYKSGHSNANDAFVFELSTTGRQVSRITNRFLKTLFSYGQHFCNVNLKTNTYVFDGNEWHDTDIQHEHGGWETSSTSVSPPPPPFSMLILPMAQLPQYAPRTIDYNASLRNDPNLVMYTTGKGNLSIGSPSFQSAPYIVFGRRISNEKQFKTQLLRKTREMLRKTYGHCNLSDNDAFEQFYQNGKLYLIWD